MTQWRITDTQKQSYIEVAPDSGGMVIRIPIKAGMLVSLDPTGNTVTLTFSSPKTTPSGVITSAKE